MRQLGKAIYIALCLLICAFPFVGMLAGDMGNQTAENRILASFPQWQTKGKWNPYFLQELGAYFEDHFALRTLLVAIDANIQSQVFGVSNVDTVTLGEDGWLYYTASLDDYQGKPALSRRGIANAVHNLSLVQQYVESKGASFLFTPVPNKATLYGTHMSYYIQKREGAASQWELLKPEIEAARIPYVDLFSLFAGQEETLYLKRDSHWNQKGAMLAYRAIMEAAGFAHEDYETVKAIRQKDAYGDLSQMIYPLGNERDWGWASFLKAEPEWEYRYQKENTFQYQTNTKSTEEAWIETKSQEGQKTLLMSRDSFGNTLLPFLADAFGMGYFSRGEPFRLTEYMDAYQPDVVILEKVERELESLAKAPPLMEGLPAESTEDTEDRKGTEDRKDETQDRENKTEERTGTEEKVGTEEKTGLLEESAGSTSPDGTLEMAESENSIDYWKISGVLPDAFCIEGAQISIRVKDGKEQADYAAFHVTADTTDYAFCLYLPKENLQEDAVTLEVLVRTEDGLHTVQSAQFPCRVQ